uniref:Uncharacterized protein n=1 Tax=Anguilla anguilla TaxID=7936 RepID=A0A0E9QHH5_ANGAN
MNSNEYKVQIVIQTLNKDWSIINRQS